MARFTPKPADQRIVVRMTVGSAKVAHDACLNAYHSLGLYASLLPEGAERRAQEEARQRLLKLAAWFGRLRDDEG